MRFFLFFCALAMAGALYFQGLAIERLARVIASLEDIEMEPLVTTWTDAENLTHTVTTHRDDGQSKAAWIADHEETVALMKAAFPPAT